jgi:hypothetical protein
MIKNNMFGFKLNLLIDKSNKINYLIFKLMHNLKFLMHKFMIL